MFVITAEFFAYIRNEARAYYVEGLQQVHRRLRKPMDNTYV